MAVKRAARKKKEAAETMPLDVTPPAGSPLDVSPPDVMPLDVMLGAMRELWGRAEALKGKPECIEERLALIKQASGEAHRAAVYVHPRIASVDAETEGGVADAATSMQVSRGLGSRELARRLLFAVAVAEYLPASRETTERISNEPKLKEKP